MTKLYTVKTPKPIPCMGDIQGPMTEPTSMKFDDVLSMLCMGYEIYQHNPNKLSEKVLVTKQNIENIKFPTSKAKAISEKKDFKEMQILNKPASQLAPKKSNKSTKEDDASKKEKAVVTADAFEKN